MPSHFAELAQASKSARVDAAGLAEALRGQIRGEIRFDRGTRALYSTDGSNYRQIPIGLVIPLDEQDVIATVAACRAFDAPILSRGAGTSLAGQACNAAVILDFSKYMNAIGEVDLTNNTMRVQPGAAAPTCFDQIFAYF